VSPDFFIINCSHILDPTGYSINYLIKNNVNANVQNNYGRLPEEFGDEKTRRLIQKYRKQW